MSGTAQRCEDTSEALVGFSAALSRAGSIAEVAQALADAVPHVAGCDRSSVLLWDPFEQRLVLQAWSLAGRAPAAPAGPAGATGPAEAGARTDGTAAGGHAGRPYEVAEADADVVPVLSRSREVTVVDPATGEPSLRALLERTGARSASWPRSSATRSSWGWRRPAPRRPRDRPAGGPPRSTSACGPWPTRRSRPSRTPGSSSRSAPWPGTTPSPASPTGASSKHRAHQEIERARRRRALGRVLRRPGPLQAGQRHLRPRRGRRR